MSPIPCGPATNGRPRPRPRSPGCPSRWHEPSPPAPAAEPRSRARWLASTLAAAAAVFAAAVLLPTYLGKRQGGAVTGNEVFDAAPPNSPDGQEQGSVHGDQRGSDLSPIVREQVDTLIGEARNAEAQP